MVNLQKFPKSTLELSVLVLENDGGVLGCALTALSCALTNAGIEMYDLLIGTCCAIVASEAVVSARLTLASLVHVWKQT